MEKNFNNYYMHNFDNVLAMKQNNANEKRYFGLPSVSSTMQSFDESSDKLIKPLDGKGHLVNNDLVHMPKEFIRDTVYTTKALADGVRGKANDHQLGKMNDLGLKLGGIAIATYLMTKKSTPKTKAMEFIGFGAFLASMALWPKLALEIPARIVHGFNFRKQYIDDQGRKKFVSQDPNYIPFDLYKGDKKSEDLDVIGDRLGIKKDIPNRHEAVKEQMRKISVQNNTLWMMTAGIATPVMTALACNKAEPYVEKYAEKITNRRVNSQIQKLDDYLNNRIADNNDIEKYEQTVLGIGKKDKNGNVIPDALEQTINGLKGKVVSEEQITYIADSLAKDFDPEMKDAAKEDIVSLTGGSKYIGNKNSAQRLANNIHSTILAKDAQLAEKLNPQALEKVTSNAMIQGAVRDLLGSIAEDVIKPAGDSANETLARNFAGAEVEGIDFFKVTPETEGMTPVERLAHNIKSVIMKVNNSNPSEDFVSGMSELEGRNRDFKLAIDGKLVSGADEIAESFFGGRLAISEKHEHYIRTAIGNEFRVNAKKGPKSKKLLSDIGNVVSEEFAQNKGFVISEKVGGILNSAVKKIRKYSAVDKVLSSAAHFKTEEANETIVANSWNKVTNAMVKHLGYTDKEIELSGKSKEKSKEIFMKKMEALVSDTDRYNEFLTDMGKAMAEMDETLDAPNAKGNSGLDRLFGGAAESTTGRPMEKIRNGIIKNCDEAGNALGELGLSSMKRKMVSVHTDKLGYAGSIKDAKLNRLSSRVNGVHSTYMRLIQTAEYFRRAHLYEQAVQTNGAGNVAALGKKLAVTDDHEWNMGLFRKGKDVIVSGGSSDFYGKMGLHNKKDNFTTLMWQLFRPDQGGGAGDKLCEATEETMRVLDDVKVKEGSSMVVPRRALETTERIPLGQKLRQHMQYSYDCLGSIASTLRGAQEHVKVETGVGESERISSVVFNLLGKSPADLMHDALKQKHNSNKWMKTFAPVLAAVTAVTIGAQFFFGKKDKDIKA